MKKLQRGIKNKIMVAVLMVVMLFGMNTIPVDAAAVTTAIVSAASGHTLYVRESGSITVLGTMYLQRKSGSISNTFTASKTCIEAIVFVSSKESNFKANSKSQLLAGQSVKVEKSVEASYAYGYCTISYQK